MDRVQIVRQLIKLAEELLLEDFEFHKQAAAESFKKDPEKCRDYLTEVCKTQANDVVKIWWEFAWELVAKYNDGFINYPEKMIQEVGYPEDWLKKSKWSKGPIRYKKP